MATLPILTPPVAPPNPTVPSTFNTLAYPFMQWLYTHGNEMNTLISGLNAIDYLAQPLILSEDDMFTVPTSSTEFSYGLSINSGTCSDGVGAFFPYGDIALKAVAVTGTNSGYLVRGKENSLKLGSSYNSYSTVTLQTHSAQTSQVIYVGLHNTTTVSDPTYGCYFKITAGVVTAVTANNSTRTTSTTMTTLSNSANYKFVIVIDGIASVTFNIYDSINLLVATTTINTNLPTYTFFNGVVAIYTTTGDGRNIVILDHIGYKVISKNYATRW